MEVEKTSTSMDSISEIQRLNKALIEADESRKRIDVGQFEYLPMYWSALSSAYRNIRCLINNPEIITVLTDLRSSILNQINKARTAANIKSQKIMPTNKLMSDLDDLHEIILEQKHDLGLGIILKEIKKRDGFKW